MSHHLPSQHMDLVPFLVGCFWLILLVKRAILMQNEATNVYFDAFCGNAKEMDG